jgi:hypothetical protein
MSHAVDDWRTALVGGLALVAVPTVFGVFPEFTQWVVPWRVSITVAWLLLATLVVISAVWSSPGFVDT